MLSWVACDVLRKMCATSPAVLALSNSERIDPIFEWRTTLPMTVFLMPSFLRASLEVSGRDGSASPSLRFLSLNSLNVSLFPASRSAWICSCASAVTCDTASRSEIACPGFLSSESCCVPVLTAAPEMRFLRISICSSIAFLNSAFFFSMSALNSSDFRMSPSLDSVLSREIGFDPTSVSVFLIVSMEEALLGITPSDPSAISFLSVPLVILSRISSVAPLVFEIR